MTPRKRRILLLALAAVLITAVGFVSATQYAAAALRYQRRLGPSIAALGNIRIYAPWSWLAWDADFAAYAPRIFRTASLIGWLSLLSSWIPLVAYSLASAKKAEGSTAHGSARWAEAHELASSGLLDNQGVVICQTAEARYVASEGPKGRSWRLTRTGRLITHHGPEHVIVFAPTRSGKGIGTVVPTLLNWSSSVLVYDIKKELWTLTAGWRRQFSRCWRFEPIARDSIRFNPLLEVRRGDGEVRDVQNIAEVLVDPEGKSEKRDHWKVSAATLLVGSILHTLYAEKDKSLAGVARFLSNPNLPLVDTLQKMLGTRHLPSGPHPVVAQCAREMLDKSDNELAGIVSTAKTCVNLYNDPLIARNTSTSDFRIDDLMNADAPVSLYLVVPPSDIDRTRPLIRLMLNQIGKRLTETISFGDKPVYRHRLLFLLDEFPSLGKLDFFQTQLAYLAGYGIKAFLVAQSLNQLEAVYGQHNSILDNCHIRMTYTALDDRTAKRISDLIGTATHLKTQRSFSGPRFFRNVSESEQEHGRPLLTPDEILRLPYEDALLLVGGVAPYRGRKLMYYLDPRFRERTKLAPPDSPRRQRGELLPRRVVSDWEHLVPNDEPPSLAPAAASRPAGLAPEVASRPSPDVARELGPSGPEAPQPSPPLEPPPGIGAFAAFFEGDAAPAPPDGEAPVARGDGGTNPDEELPL
jgi:type IV secretion system protein VirD4